MKPLFSLFMTLMLGTAFGQTSIEFPFNPDSDGDGQIGSDDLLIMLSAYGEPWTLPDPNQWATGTITNLLDYDSQLNALSDSLQLLQSHLENLQDSLTGNSNAIIIDHLNNACYYNPGNGQSLAEGCTFASLRAVSSTTYGGQLTLTTTGRSEGDILTVHYSCRDGNSGTWVIRNSEGNDIASANPYNSYGWNGTYYRMHMTFLFTDGDWATF